jgi:hypothetical protein
MEGKMKYLLIGVMGIMLIGLTACESVSFLNAKNQLETIVGVTVAGEYKVVITKDDKVLVTETWVCTQEGGKLTGCHKLEKVTVTNPSL